MDKAKIIAEIKAELLKLKNADKDLRGAMENKDFNSREGSEDASSVASIEAQIADLEEELAALSAPKATI